MLEVARLRRALFAFVITLAAAGSAAQQAPLPPHLQERADALAHRLRCLVCQNQSIAESDADLAKDLRQQVREQLEAGRSEQEIADYMVARYGDFVLYQPPVKATTLLLWGGPALLLAAAFGAFALTLRARRRTATATLSAEDHARAAALLNNTPDDNPEPRA